MLIYNHKKEFIGIDAQDLNTLGFSTFQDLKEEFADFADMFVKKPGYVHNFKHVNWIDFVTCADSIESTKVMINANGRNFRCLLEIKIAYLNDEPSSKAFLVYLTNIREISSDGEETTPEKQFEKPFSTPEPIFTSPKIEEIIPSTPSTDIYESQSFDHPIDTEIDKSFDAPIDTKIDESFNEPIDLDLPLELDFKDEVQEQALEESLKIDLEIDEDVQTTDETIKKQEVQTETAIFDNGYIYNPQVASDELGLPVDLIEEFIEDFIAQAKEFKDGLYTALHDGDNDNLKILSHKLKGVAANLRIEDALESLTIINTSDSTLEIETQLDLFYKIISKLSGEKILVTKTVTTEVAQQSSEIPQEEDETEIFIDTISDETISDTTDESDVDLDIFAPPKEKDTPPPSKEDDIPMSIDIPELADDDFLKIDTIETNEIDFAEEESLDSDFVAQSLEDPEEVSLESQEPEILETEIAETEVLDTQESIDIFSPEETTKEPKVSHYDTKLVAGEIGLSQEHFMEFLQEYLTEAQELSALISKAIENNEHTVWKSKAMELKSMSDNMRVDEFMSELKTLIQTQDPNIAKNANLEIAESLVAISKIQE